MARALMGHIGSAQDDIRAFEIIRLRRRIVELEAEVARLRETHTADLDIELHRITEASEPALA